MNDLLDEKARLLGSLLLFTKVFYKLRTGREFIVSQPIGRIPKEIVITTALTRMFNGGMNRLLCQIPPRYGKTELAIHFVAWAMAHYPDSNFMYISYSKTVAEKQTSTIRNIVSMPLYRQLFDVEISKETNSKSNFRTKKGGEVYAAGADGTITSFGAGITGVDRFAGCIILDDMHKPNEVSSDTMRNSVKDGFSQTIMSRLNDPTKTPIFAIAQSLHEDDIMESFKKGVYGDHWEQVILPALDKVNNALDPSKHTAEALLNMEKFQPYEYWAQYQQQPQPAGGGIFKKDWFRVLETEPKMICTFITADTAETSKTYNDATVFSFFGLYAVNPAIGLYAIHILNCQEIWVEPKDLHDYFYDFYSKCMTHEVKPMLAVIEKKSTGVTLSSVMSQIQGLRIIDCPRTNKDGNIANKIERFLNIQYYVSSGLVTLPFGGRHNELVIEHMRKITANDSHRNDDIADTIADAVKVGLIDKTLINMYSKSSANNTAALAIAEYNQRMRDILSNGGKT
jgi:hypothetical protein